VDRGVLQPANTRRARSKCGTAGCAVAWVQMRTHQVELRMLSKKRRVPAVVSSDLSSECFSRACVPDELTLSAQNGGTCRRRKLTSHGTSQRCGGSCLNCTLRVEPPWWAWNSNGPSFTVNRCLYVCISSPHAQIPRSAGAHHHAFGEQLQSCCRPARMRQVAFGTAHIEFSAVQVPKFQR
jgi:hypothetical protein